MGSGSRRQPRAAVKRPKPPISVAAFAAGSGVGGPFADATCNIARNIINGLMRLVLDTAVMVAAIRSDAGASRRLVGACLLRRLTPLISVPLVIEYESVMTRVEHLTASGLSVADVEALLDAILAVSEPVRLAFLWRPGLTDVNDDMVLEAAVNGRADAIATFNRRDFVAAATRFGIDVLSPAAAVLQMETEQ